MKSGGFHGLPLNAKYTVYFMKSNTESSVFHLVQPYHSMLNTQCISVLDFMKKYTAYLAFSGRPWNLPDFMKSARFHGHEIYWIPPWNPADFMTMKSGRFHDAKWAKDQWSYFYPVEILFFCVKICEMSQILGKHCAKFGNFDKFTHITCRISQLFGIFLTDFGY